MIEGLFLTSCMLEIALHELSSSQVCTLNSGIVVTFYFLDIFEYG
jgi:hypothetical protein